MQKVYDEKALFPAPAAGMRVGVFDSGVGGLNVLAACVRRLPHCLFFYFGDNRHAPYGSRTPAQITRFVRAALGRFAALGVDAAVLACNTATAVCAQAMRAEFPFPVIGMEPAVASAARVCSHALVLATPRTAGSARLKALIGRFPQCRFTVCALPGLAGAVERRFARGKKLTLSDHLPACSCDGVVLGCTHYAFFGHEIGDFYHAPVFDGIEGTAERLVHVLAARQDAAHCGTADHLRPKQNPNKCFNKNYKKTGKSGVIFLGNAKNFNKMVYKTNICFTKK